MAVAYTLNVQGYRATFNRDAGTYTVELGFSCTGQSNLLTELTFAIDQAQFVPGSWTTSGADLPDEVHLTHAHRRLKQGQEALESSANQDLICYLVSKELQNATSQQTIDILCTYEGRLKGVHSIDMRTQMVSEPIYHSLRKNADAAFDAIEPEQGGTTRDVPLVVYRVMQVIPDWACKLFIDADNKIAGSVNEDNWVAPWNTAGSEAEGSFLYLGVVETQFERRTRTVELYHEFARLQDRDHQAIYKWYLARRKHDAVTGEVTTDYFDTQLAYIQGVAGTDKWYDGKSIIPAFATLGLTAPLY